MALKKDLDFKVRSVDPEFGKPYNIKTKEFQGLFHEKIKTLLGVKKSQDKNALEPLLYFTYRELYEIAKKLYSKLFHKPSAFLFDATSPDFDRSTIFISYDGHEKEKEFESRNLEQVNYKVVHQNKSVKRFHPIYSCSI